MRWPSSGVTARVRRDSSAPIHSVVSDKTTRPPSSTTLSATMPVAGLLMRPETESEPPHSTPSISSLMGTSTRFCSEALMTNSFAYRTARQVVLIVPPHSSHEQTTTSFPESRMISAIRPAITGSIVTTTAAKTLGFAPSPPKVAICCSKSAPTSPRPKQGQTSTVPVTQAATRRAMKLLLSIALITAT